MAEILTNQSTGVFSLPAPTLAGYYNPAIDLGGIPDGWGLSVPWGSGQVEVRQTPLGVSLETPEPKTSLESLTTLALGPVNLTTINLEGLVGPQGPPGPPGPAGVGLGSLSSLLPLGEQPVTSGGGGTAQFNIDVPFTSGIDWTDNSPAAGSVAWSSGTLIYKGTEYSIPADNTSDTYIYWDSASPTTFQHTSTLSDAIGTTKWLMCYNDGGTAYPAFATKILHAGLIQSGTITADQIAANTINASHLLVNGANIFENLAVQNQVTGSTQDTNDFTTGTLHLSWEYKESSLIPLSSAAQSATWSWILDNNGGSWTGKAYFYLKNASGTVLWDYPTGASNDPALAWTISSSPTSKEVIGLQPIHFGISIGSSFRIGVACGEINGNAVQIRGTGGTYHTTVSDAEILKRTI